jgi:hypothetical protein
MKTMAILAAIVAVSAVTAHAEPKPQFHQPGSPIKQGPYCWVYTNGTGAGWWDRCADAHTERAQSLKNRFEADISAIENDTNGGGGGGGGGGK